MSSCWLPIATHGATAVHAGLLLVVQPRRTSMPAATTAPRAAVLSAKDPAACSDAAEHELQSRQQRLSCIASAAKDEVMQLRAERSRLADQLQQLSTAVAELPQPPKPLVEAQSQAQRCLKSAADTQGAGGNLTRQCLACMRSLMCASLGVFADFVTARLQDQRLQGSETSLTSPTGVFHLPCSLLFILLAVNPSACGTMPHADAPQK